MGRKRIEAEIIFLAEMELVPFSPKKVTKVDFVTISKPLLENISVKLNSHISIEHI